MKTRSISRSPFLHALLFGSVLSLGFTWTSVSHAAQGCGFGNHMTAFGRCVPNSPGPWARPAPGRPDCWINGQGLLRCWR